MRALQRYVRPRPRPARASCRTVRDDPAVPPLSTMSHTIAAGPAAVASARPPLPPSRPALWQRARHASSSAGAAGCAAVSATGMRRPALTAFHHATPQSTSQSRIGTPQSGFHPDTAADRGAPGLATSESDAAAYIMGLWAQRRARMLADCASDAEAEAEAAPGVDAEGHPRALGIAAAAAATAAQQQPPSVLKRLLEQPPSDPRGVFVCHSDLEWETEVSVLGFDLDYTLAHWSTGTLLPRIFDGAVAALVHELGYPPELQTSLSHDHSFAIRGLYFDARPGCGYLVKLDAGLKVEVCFSGRRQFTRREIEAAYPGLHIPRDVLAQLVPLHDLYALPEADLVSALIQWLVDSGLEFDASVVIQDVRRAVTSVHESKQLHDAIAADPGAFVTRSETLVRFLRSLRGSSGGGSDSDRKSTFLLTNSPYTYVDAVMAYLTQGLLPAGDSEDGPGSGSGRGSTGSWRDLFDVIVVQAGKPGFFGQRRPFREVDPETGSIRWVAVNALELGSGKVYCNGNITDFVRLTGWEASAGERVLFCGDHIAQDAKHPRHHGWRTAVVVRELEHDIVVQNSRAYKQLLAQMLELRAFIANVQRCTPHVTTAARRAAVAQLRLEQQRVAAELRGLFGSPFGSVFASATQSSLFASSVMRHSDLYLSRVDNFCSPAALTVAGDDAAGALADASAELLNGPHLPRDGSRPGWFYSRLDTSKFLPHDAKTAF